MKILVLCSGGLKSWFLTALARKEASILEVLFFDHSQSNLIQEQEAATSCATHYEAEFLKEYLVGPPPGWYPFKLSCMLWRAIITARLREVELLYYGVSKDDYQFIWGEARRPHLSMMKLLVERIRPHYDEDGFLLRKLEIEAPLILLDLKRVIRLGNEYLVPWKEAWTCSGNNRRHCGTCEHCIRRRQAFIDEGSKDPTQYNTKGEESD